MNHLPIEIFLKGLNDKPHKAYVAMIVGFDKSLTAYCMETDGILVNWMGMNPAATFSFQLEILLAGGWTDYDDATDVVWEPRNGGDT
jgi:hypothetical protein